MDFIKFVPNIFYVDIKDGIKLFIDCLQFKIIRNELHSKPPSCVIEKNGLRIYIFQNKELAEEHKPDFRLETNNIKEVYEKIVSSHPELLHPKLDKITPRPWGAKEFAIMDKQLWIIIQEW